jgi:hypothetical protein
MDMTGDQMKAIRHALGEAIGWRLSLADMAKLCGLKDPEGNGRETYRKWEEGEGPSGPVAMLLELYVDLPCVEMLDIIRERLEGES